MTDKINIAIVSHSYPTMQEPAQATFIKKEAHLLSDVYKIEVYLPSVYALPMQRQYYRSLHPDESELTVHQFSYLSFPGKKLASITRKSLSKNLLKKLAKQNPDLVHLHWLYPSGLAVPSLKEAGYPVVLTIHGGDWYSNQSNQTLMPLLSKSLLLCDKIICVGKQLTRDISSFHSGLQDKLVHIPHGIDTGLFNPIPDNEIIMEEIGWNREKRNLLCIANLYHGKGVDILIRAFSSISDRKKCHLHIVSPAGSKEAKSKIDQLINQHKLHHQVSFYDSMKQSRLVYLIRSADLLISPSRKEGFGLVVAEAIACGTPVLATRSGGPEEIVNPDCGMLVEANSTDSLSAGLENILKKLNSYQADKMHQYIKTNFSIDAKKEKLEAVYCDITS